MVVSSCVLLLKDKLEQTTSCCHCTKQNKPAALSHSGVHLMTRDDSVQGPEVQQPLRSCTERETKQRGQGLRHRHFDARGHVAHSSRHPPHYLICRGSQRTRSIRHPERARIRGHAHLPLHVSRYEFRHSIAARISTVLRYKFRHGGAELVVLRCEFRQVRVAIQSAVLRECRFG